VYFQYFDSGLDFGVGELDLAVYSAWSLESLVEDIDSVGSHDDFDGLGALETV
jgi:hypothetical protein